jgi:hypothetical protein
MMVPSPLASRVTPTSNLVRMATSTVAGNMVSTCWKPRLNMAPQPGTSSGMYPNTFFSIVAVAICVSLLSL